MTQAQWDLVQGLAASAGIVAGYLIGLYRGRRQGRNYMRVVASDQYKRRRSA